MSAFIPASGLSAAISTPVGRPSALAPLRPSRASTVPSNAPVMVAYPYTGSGYGAAGVGYANDKTGQFFQKTTTEDIPTTAASVSIFSSLVSLLVSTGLDYELQKGGPFTVFAPTNDAITNALLGPHGFSVIGPLLRPENVDALRSLLAYHVIPGDYSAASIVTLGGKVDATALNGDPITVMNYNRKVSAGSAPVVRADVPCTNGVIHVIDSLLLPPSYVTPPVPEPQLQYPESIISDMYAKLPTPRQNLGIDPAPGSSLAQLPFSQ